LYAVRLDVEMEFSLFVCFVSSCRFYKVLNTCVTSSSSHALSKCEKLHLELCENTTWSSFAPDPKSQIGLMNLTTGRLNRQA